MRTALAALISIAACGSGSTPKPDAATDGFDRSMLLDHLANRLLLPLQTQFATVAARLPPALTAYCDALDQGAPGATRDAARAAWVETMDAWEAADALLVGP